MYRYLASRGVAAAWGERLFGILAASRELPSGIAWWPAAGFRLVVPLFTAGDGRLVSCQARNIGINSRTRILSPKGPAPGPKLFASDRGQALLAGDRELALAGSPAEVAVLGEGLTDFLALGAALPDQPVLSVPGTASAPTVIGPWVTGLDLVLAFDGDRAGQQAAKRTTRAARAHGATSVYGVRWPQGMGDAADVARQHGLDQLREEVSP